MIQFNILNLGSFSNTVLIDILGKDSLCLTMILSLVLVLVSLLMLAFGGAGRQGNNILG